MTITAGVREALLKEARGQAPLEACGLLGGLAGVAVTFYPCRNAAQSPVFFTIDPGEILSCLRTMERAGEELAGIFHSHPAAPARPSAADRLHAHYPHTPYLILSLAGGGTDLRGFDMSQDPPQEIPIADAP